MAIDQQAKTFREGRWSEDEHELFQRGVERFGWGNWAMMATMIPSRSTKQIKSHAQKVAKIECWKCVLLRLETSVAATAPEANELP